MKSYHHGNLKEELIDCACRLCERDGYTKLSIRSLAKESGVSQTAPYRHFETKEALYAEVATNGFKKLSEACYIDVEKKVTQKQLVDAGCRYIEFGLKNANTYDLMFGTAVGNFANYPKLLEAADKTYDPLRQPQVPGLSRHGAPPSPPPTPTPPPTPRANITEHPPQPPPSLRVSVVVCLLCRSSYTRS